MDAALKIVCAFRETGDQRRAALNDPGLSYGDFVKASRAFRSRVLPIVQAEDEAAPALLYLGEGVRLITKRAYTNLPRGDRGSFPQGKSPLPPALDRVTSVPSLANLER
jgi:hypothetical protein